MAFLLASSLIYSSSMLCWNTLTCLSIDLASLLRIKADASCYGLSFGLIFVRGGSLPLCSADAGGSCGSGDVGDLGDFERVSVGGSEFVSG